MKTVQIGNGKAKVIQFETLQEVQSIYTEKQILSFVNAAYKRDLIKARKLLSGSKAVKK